MDIQDQLEVIVTLFELVRYQRPTVKLLRLCQLRILIAS